MKRFLPLLVAVVLGCLFDVRAQGPDNQYIQIYNLMQQAEGLKGSGQDNAALQKYLEAESDLKKFKNIYPDWNPRIVDFRLKYLAARIAPLSASNAPSLQVELAAPPKGHGTNVESDVDYAARIGDLENHVKRLESEKVVLESKLKEALSVQPTVVSPQELDEARQKVDGLTQENEDLKAKLESERERAAHLPDPSEVEALKANLAEINRKLVEQLEITSTLQQEKDVLQQKLESSMQTAGGGAAALESLKAENARLKTLLAEAEQRASALPENIDGKTLEALRSENKQLKEQIVNAGLKQSEAGSPSSAAASEGDPATVIASLKADRDVLQLEKAALQNRIRTLSVAGPAAANGLSSASSPETAERIKRLEAEKQDLEKKLQAATRNLDGSDSQSQQRVQQMADQMADLHARIEVLEARRVPYTEEELALMKTSKPIMATDDDARARPSAKDLPSGTANLAAQAQAAFARGDYADAEQKYRQVLERDQKNVYTLGNLAAIQLEQGKINEAETNLTRALEAEPNDAFCLSLLGYLKYQQNKLDEALDALGRAAKLDPQSAETQNYLGIVLSNKGFRGPAETALRRAVQLKPDYASAHNNLAVIYITQKPPMVELARWHYQKALANGHKPNPELEQMIEKAGGAPVGQ